MKKILIFFIIVCMVFSTCSVSIASTNTAPCLTLSKTVNDDFGTSITYTSKPVTITVTPMPSPPSGQTITVQAPAVSPAGSVVAYGTEVVISSPEQGHIAYSINGGDYIYSYESTVTITVTEDTELRVKAWIDALAEDTEYITPEAVYTYTINNAVSEYPYSIEALAVTNDTGEILTEPPMDTGFIVDMTLKEIKERDARDQMFVAVYDPNGKLLSLDYVRCNLAADSEFSIGFYIPPQDSAIGSIKAFIWNSFDTPEPLAASAELRF